MKLYLVLSTAVMSSFTFPMQPTGLTGSPLAIGDLMYSTLGTQAMTRLADVATGSVLVSGGVGVAPAYSSSPTLIGTITAPHFISSGAPAIALGVLPGTGPNGAAVSLATGSNDEAGSVSVTYGSDYSNASADPNDDVFVITLSSACAHGIAVSIFPTNDLAAAYWNNFSVNTSRKIRQISSSQWALTYPGAGTPTQAQPYTFTYMARCY